MGRLIDENDVIEEIDHHKKFVMEVQRQKYVDLNGMTEFYFLAHDHIKEVIKAKVPSAQPEPFVDADKLKRCRFEYINACKIVARPTPDTSKSDIYDAHAVIKALHPIFGDVEF